MFFLVVLQLPEDVNLGHRIPEPKTKSGERVGIVSMQQSGSESDPGNRIIPSLLSDILLHASLFPQTLTTATLAIPIVCQLFGVQI